MCAVSCLRISYGIAPSAWLLVQVRTLLRRDGLIRGMYAGYGAFLLRDLPFDAIEFWAFDTLNIRLKAYVNRELNALEQGVCGAVAGAVTGVPRCTLAMSF